MNTSLLKARLATAFLFLGLAAQALAGEGNRVSTRTGGTAFSLHPEAKYQPGHIIFKLLPGASLEAVAQTSALLQAGTPVRVYPRHKGLSGVELKKQYVDLSLIYEFTYSAPITLEYAVNAMRRVKGIQYAEPRYIHKTTFIPNDPLRTLQGHFARIKAYQAYDVHKGDTNTYVGIVDSGVDWDHPDMVGNIAYNRADPINGVDDDNDGYIDNYRGWDLAGADYNAVNPIGDNDPQMTGLNNDHGAHVAGIAGSTTNNRVGVIGTGYNCRILPVKCAADNDSRGGGFGYILSGYEGITYAADHGCRVINCSWGGPGVSGYENDIINYASFNKNALVVCAAGNDNSGGDFFPAYYDNVLSVAAVDNSDRKADFSNYSYKVGVAAPGVGIYSTVYDNAYGTKSGTSMASPVVAGAAALLASYQPQLSPSQLAAQIRATSDDIYNISANSSPNLAGKLGKGRINMQRMLTKRGPGLVASNITLSDNNNEYFESGDTIRLSADFINKLWPGTQALSATITCDDPAVQIINNTATFSLANLGTNDTADNRAFPFFIVIDTSASVDQLISLKLSYTDSSYADVQYTDFLVNPTFVNFSRNTISSTVSSIGRLGYAGTGQTKGLGVQYYGSGSLAYEVGLISGVSANSIANCVRGMGQVVAEDFESIVRAKIDEQPSLADLEIAGRFVDGTIQGTGLEYGHRTYAWNGGPDTNYYIHRLTIRNKTARGIANLFTGIYEDADVSAGGQGDRAGYDAARKLAYVYDTAQYGLYTGIALLGAATPNVYLVQNDGTAANNFGVYDGFTDAEKFASISSGIVRTSAPAAGTTKDVSFSIGAGPMQVNGGDSTEVAFAIVVGASLAEVQTAADRANYQYNQLTPTRKGLVQTLSLVPNPARGQAYIQGLPAEVSQVTLVSTDGRAVQLPTTKAGTNMALNLSGLAPGLYSVSVRAASGAYFRGRVVVE